VIAVRRLSSLKIRSAPKMGSANSYNFSTG